MAFGLFVFAMFMATDAGRLNESGAGAWRIAPELAAHTRSAQSAPACPQPATATRSELLFETLDPATPDAELARMMATGSREVIDFQWNPATSELTFSATANGRVFSDLANGAAGIPATQPGCGSR